ncbi:MAG: xanthine dehydrogenase family protein molybdopterin-binding subunit, partial [Smithella sp.]
MNSIFKINRRNFLQLGISLSGSLILGLNFSSPEGICEAETMTSASHTLNAFIRISTDDTITITVNKSEMGQGVYTSLPMLIAEELECDWKKIRVEAAPVNPAYNHTEWGPMQATGGSTSIRSEWERFQKVGATAREMLLAAAAKTWKVNKKTCRAENSRVFDSNGRSLTFGELAKTAARMPLPKQVILKDPANFKIIGKPVKRLDTPEKTNGKAIFGFDTGLPGMLTALIARPPVFGGKVISIKTNRTMAVPGVKNVVQVPSGVAVIAEGFWPAKKGRDLLEIIWDEGSGAEISTPDLQEHYKSLAKTKGTVARKEGDTETAFRSSIKKVTAEYEVPYLAHALMEPLNCLIDFRGDSCEIWTGTQAQTRDRNAAAKILGLNPDQVKLHTTLLGGGFGRRSNPHSDFVTEAAYVAKALGKPVKVVWSREDDIRGGYYRPMWSDRMVAALDLEGNPVAWQHTIVGQSILESNAFKGVENGIDATSLEGAQDIPYNIPNIQVELHSPRIGVPVQWWRSVGHSHTAFVVESFIDELAYTAKKDPFEYRLKLLAYQPRHKGVLELVAQKAKWGSDMPAGYGRGIALHSSYGSYVAYVAEVSVSDDGRVHVHKIVCAIDCGRVVNPDTVAAQMEGGMVFGLTAALHGEITLNNGRVKQSNFHNYRMLRMNEMPEMEVH